MVESQGITLKYLGTHPETKQEKVEDLTEFKVSLNEENKVFTLGENQPGIQALAHPENLLNNHFQIKIQDQKYIMCDFSGIAPVSVQLKPKTKYYLNVYDFFFLSPNVGIHVSNLKTKSVGSAPEGWKQLNKVTVLTVPPTPATIPPPSIELSLYACENFRIKTEGVDFQNPEKAMFGEQELKKPIKIGKSEKNPILDNLSCYNKKQKLKTKLQPKHVQINYDEENDAFYIEDVGSKKSGTYITFKPGFHLITGIKNELKGKVPSPIEGEDDYVQGSYSDLILMEDGQIINICGHLFQIAK